MNGGVLAHTQSHLSGHPIALKSPGKGLLSSQFWFLPPWPTSPPRLLPFAAVLYQQADLTKPSLPGSSGRFSSSHYQTLPSSVPVSVRGLVFAGWKRESNKETPYWWRLMLPLPTTIFSCWQYYFTDNIFMRYGSQAGHMHSLGHAEVCQGYYKPQAG